MPDILDRYKKEKAAKTDFCNWFRVKRETLCLSLAVFCLLFFCFRKSDEDERKTVLVSERDREPKRERVSRLFTFLYLIS
jgi:hypothetical protein